jgi:SPASM domain peptide maturase of grasp-with-spasm system
VTRVERTVFRLYAHCVAVRGARRSTVCDLQRRAWYVVPNALYEIVTAHRDQTRAELHARFGPENAAVIDSYFAFLEAHELGWWTGEPERFPPLDLGWDAPARVTNAIIDADDGSNHDFASLFAQLGELGCRTVQLRVYDAWTLERLDAAVAPSDRGRVQSVEVMAPWRPEWSDPALLAFCERHPRVISFFATGAPERRVVPGAFPGVCVVYRTERVDSEAHCGQVHPGYFMATLSAFAEAQAHNSCLNRKLGVDRRGGIRNCPSMPRVFGNAARTPLAEALESPGFRDAWHVTRDQVEVCRDCEFRYVCTDCRAYTAPSPTGHGKPARCAYDPYTAIWADEAEAVPAEDPDRCPPATVTGA